jgi:hypothetical protein
VAWPAGTGILADGDFSKAPNPTGGREFDLGQSFAPAWEVIKGNVDFQGTGDVWSMGPDGACSVDLDGDMAGGIAHREFPTTANVTYAVTFEFSGNGGCGQIIKKLLVRAAGRSDRLRWSISGGNDAENGVWQAETWTFTGTGSPARQNS